MGVERVPLRVSHERRSLRLRGFDYSRPGVYFVTIRARHDGPMFGELVATHMRLGQYGRIVTACWLEIPKHFPHVTLGIHVVMPDHMHGIIVINERADADNVGAQHAAPLQLQHGGRLQQDARLSQTALRAHAIRASTTVAGGRWERSFARSSRLSRSRSTSFGGRRANRSGNATITTGLFATMASYTGFAAISSRIPIDAPTQASPLHGERQKPVTALSPPPG